MGAVKKLYVNERHLVSLEEIKKNTLIHNPDGTSFLAVAGDMLATNQFGEQYTVPKKYIAKYPEVEKVKSASLYEEMAKGYEDMGQINLEEANVGHNATNRAEMLTAQLLAGKNNL
ncbi:antitoxin endoai [Bacillus altitudinis]|uniref:antitoxin endoai n=1 Tax=Bacillus altitudinis TaxID=293387 RepID=UPI0011A0DCC0|nr:antitoxin endoai [Bacillus altitudinis]